MLKSIQLHYLIKKLPSLAIFIWIQQNPCPQGSKRHIKHDKSSYESRPIVFITIFAIIFSIQIFSCIFINNFAKGDELSAIVLQASSSFKSYCSQNSSYSFPSPFFCSYHYVCLLFLLSRTLWLRYSNAALKLFKTLFS